MKHASDGYHPCEPVNLSTSRPKGRAAREVHPEPCFPTPSLKGGALHSRTGVWPWKSVLYVLSTDGIPANPQKPCSLPGGAVFLRHIMQFNPSHIHSVFIPLTSLLLFLENLNGQYFLLASSLVTNIIVPPLPSFAESHRL